MWLWQHKNIHKRHLLWAKLFGICLFFHLIFLFWVFCVYRDNSYILSISINKKLDYSTPIMFVPLGVPTATHSKPTVVKKPISAKSVVIQAKALIQKKAPVVEPKKPITVAAVTPKKPEEKKQPIIEPKKETPKMEPKKEVAPIQKIATTEPPKSTPIKTAEPPKLVPPVAQALDTQQTIVPLIPENAHISHNYREVEALRRGAQLQKELVRQWKPPIGVSPECMCEISFFVNTTGIIEDLKMVKGSGVVMYDISARQALFAMKMPQWTYGKSLIISFKQ